MVLGGEATAGPLRFAAQVQPPPAATARWGLPALSRVGTAVSAAQARRDSHSGRGASRERRSASRTSWAART